MSQAFVSLGVGTLAAYPSLSVDFFWVDLEPACQVDLTQDMFLFSHTLTPITPSTPPALLLLLSVLSRRDVFIVSNFFAEAVSDRCSGGGGDQQKQWQDEISTGFDRLVAYATQVDSRRKSNDSLGQPQPLPPPTNYQKPEADKRTPPPPPPPPPPAAAKDPYDRMSALSMKFKRAATGGYAGSSAATGHRHPVSPSGLGGLPQRASTSGTPKRSGLSATSSIPPELLMADDRSQSPPPPPSSSSESKNLPEHHFKKRYFAASRQQSSDSFDSGGAAPSAMGPSAPVQQQPVLNMKKRPSLLGSTRQMSRSSPEPEDNGDGNEGDGSSSAVPAPTK